VEKTRLDYMGSAKEVAQIAAVLGREFGYPLIRAVAGLSDAMLAAALERLAGADLVHALGLPPDSTYRFKHALVQDAQEAAICNYIRKGWREYQLCARAVFNTQFPKP
jgi:predicted ATPase